MNNDPDPGKDRQSQDDGMARDAHAALPVPRDTARDPLGPPQNPPERAISAWVTRSSTEISRLSRSDQSDLNAEMYGIAAAATQAFGLARQHADIDSAPRATVYRTTLAERAVTVGGDRVALRPEASETAKADLLNSARDIGIDPARLARRLASGAANAYEETAWVRADITDVAAHHGLDLGDGAARSRAAAIVDRFYETAAQRIHAARAAEVSRDGDHLLATLGTMAKLHGAEGAVAFRREDQARDFAADMTARYGATVIRDLVAGRTDALASDISGRTDRQAIAAAVTAAAKEHPAFGLRAAEVEAAQRSVATAGTAPERSADRSRRHHDRDREL